MTAAGDDHAVDDRPRSIGAVVDELLPDFPDLTVSKIRFLESEGLVSPERASSGYRRYRAEDVARLRYVLVAQRDRFWPLKVIRDALDALDRGLQPPDAWPDPEGTPGMPAVPVGSVDDEVPPARELQAQPRLRLTAAEVRAGSGLDAATFDSLVTYGILRPDDDGHYDGPAVDVATAAAALAAVGIEARHLRPFRTAADREIGLVRQAVRPGDDDERARVLRHCLALHVALVKDGLRT